jgi:hypothetical protein
MTQFPLHDNLRDARRARAEGYAGTVSDARLVWLPPGRPMTLPVVALAAVSALIALLSLALPVVGLAPDAASSGSDLLAPRLGYHYRALWIAVCAVLVAGALAVAAATWSGGPAPRRRGNPVLALASALFALAAVAASVFLLAHTADLALGALGRSGPFFMPTGVRGWRPGPLWPYSASPGPALWASLAAGLVCLVPPGLLCLSATTGRARSVNRVSDDNRRSRHLTSTST